MLKKKKKSRGSRDFNCGFEFGERDGPSHDDDWAMADVMKQLKKKVENDHSYFITDMEQREEHNALHLCVCSHVLRSVCREP